ncbi:MAG: AMIN domain-containing protein [Deltaproteobacteria bacterium]|nr:AMIN domain-containing protein [Deltaproteobacteria bacterium]
MSDLMNKIENEEIEMSTVVKLKVEGSTSTVNTIEDQRTGRGVSLVCPFPALEVDIPVTFSSKDGSSNSGRIHRITVEDDPGSGLPKLRLSVRNDKESEEYAAIDTNEIDSEQVLSFGPGGEKVINMKDSTANLLDGILEDVADKNTQELLNWDDSGELAISDRDRDPGWVSEGPLFNAGAMGISAKSRRKRIAGAVAAWSMVMGIAAGGMYTLAKAGIVDADNIKGKLFTLRDNSFEKSSKRDVLSELNSDFKNSDNEKAPADEIVNSTVKADLKNMFKTVSLKKSVDNISEKDVESAAVNNMDAASGEISDDEAVVNGNDDSIESEKEIVNISEQSQIILPTRWPAEFSTSYRLQNPNGVVIDIPGGLVKKEGWINISSNEKIIKSIKAIQKESGARFIIYVQGDLPNFKTKALKEGIRLNLYYDDLNGSGGAAQEIAMK